MSLAVLKCVKIREFYDFLKFVKCVFSNYDFYRSGFNM